MKTLALIFCVFALGCGKAVTEKTAPEQPQAQEIEDAPTLDKDQHYSETFIKGYNDGFDGNWLAPINWLVANEYRSGWTAGKKDREEKNSHFFNSSTPL